MLNRRERNGILTRLGWDSYQEEAWHGVEFFTHEKRPYSFLFAKSMGSMDRFSLITAENFEEARLACDNHVTFLITSAQQFQTILESIV